MTQVCKVDARVRRWLWFSSTPYVALVLLAAVCALTPLLAWALDSYAWRVAWTVSLAVPVFIAVYVPFVAALAFLVQGRQMCDLLSPGLLLYFFFGIQLAHTQIAYAVFAGDEANSYSNVCGSQTPPSCSVADAPYLTYFAFFYYIVDMYASVGLGDILPLSTVARAVTIPLTWSAIFFLALLFGRIAHNAAHARDQDESLSSEDDRESNVMLKQKNIFKNATRRRKV